MNWQTKALIQRTIARLPFSEQIYKIIQKRFGTLDSDPWFRIPHHLEMLGLMREAGFDPAGKEFFEVGTGHRPYLPIGFSLIEAAKVITVDLNPRLDQAMCADMVRRMIDDKHNITSAYAQFIPPEKLAAKLEAMDPWACKPMQYLARANIDYRAPADAAKTGLPDESIDCHFSVTTLEHIGPEALRAIFTEARRILKDDGLAVHLIDMSDHFQHQDSAITKINFLQFSRAQWEYLAGNRFGYCNRLRASQFRALFQELGFEIILEKANLDQASLAALNSGFALDEQFSGFDPEDVCTTRLAVVMRKTT